MLAVQLSPVENGGVVGQFLSIWVVVEGLTGYLRERLLSVRKSPEATANPIFSTWRCPEIPRNSHYIHIKRHTKPH